MNVARYLRVYDKWKIADTTKQKKNFARNSNGNEREQANERIYESDKIIQCIKHSINDFGGINCG